MYCSGLLGGSVLRAIEALLGALPINQAKKAKVYICAQSNIPDEGFSRPFILVAVPDDLIRTNVKTGAFLRGGTLPLIVEDDIPPDLMGNPNAAAHDFQYWIDHIVDDIWNIVGTGAAGQLAVVDVDTEVSLQRSWQTQDGDYFQAHLAIKFGED